MDALWGARHANSTETDKVGRVQHALEELVGVRDGEDDRVQALELAQVVGRDFAELDRGAFNLGSCARKKKAEKYRDLGNAQLPSKVDLSLSLSLVVSLSRARARPASLLPFVLLLPVIIQGVPLGKMAALRFLR